MYAENFLPPRELRPRVIELLESAPADLSRVAEIYRSALAALGYRLDQALEDFRIISANWKLSPIGTDKSRRFLRSEVWESRLDPRVRSSHRRISITIPSTLRMAFDRVLFLSVRTRRALAL